MYAGEEPGRFPFQSQGTNESLHSESQAGAAFNNHAGGSFELDPTTPEGRRAGNLRSNASGRLHFQSDVSRMPGNTQTRHLGRYDEVNSNVYDEHDPFLEKSTPREDASRKALTKFLILKKVYRFIIFGLIAAIMLGSNYVINWTMDVNGSWNAAGDTHELTIKSTKCFVYLSNQGEIGSGLSISLVSHELIFTPNILFSRKKVYRTFTSSGIQRTLEVATEIEDYSCSISVTWPKNVELNSLKVSCQHCTVISRETLKIAKLLTDGNTIHLNIQSLQAGTITATSKSGTLQFNELSLASDSFFRVTNGTVIIQSRTDIAVNLISTNEEYCLSAPTVQSIVNPTCVTTTVTDELVSTLYNMSEYSQCSGKANLCLASTCTPTTTLNFETLTGAVYVNLLNNDSSYTASDSAKVLSGAIFQKAIGLSSNDWQNLLSVLKQADSVIAMPLVLKVDIGNFKAESSASTKWIVTEYPLGSVYDPWTIAGMTFGIFTWNFKELSFALSPGLCPWRPSLNRQQYASIKSLISTIANSVLSDSVYTGVVLEGDDSFLTLPNNTYFSNQQGFYEPNYDEEPQILDIASKFGANIEGAIFSPPSREYNTFNISTYINYVVFIPAFYSLYYLIKWWMQWMRSIRSRRFLNMNANPNTYSREERSEYHSYLNMDNNKRKGLEEGPSFDRTEGKISLSIPTFTLYIELLFWKVFNKVINSVDHFYEILFEEKSIVEIYDNELIEGSTSQACELDVVKEYYQQFCYWNLFEEEDLLSAKNISKLSKKGYKIAINEDEIPIIKKLLLRKGEANQANPEMNPDDYKSSLHAFIDQICVQTNYDSDEVRLNLFTDSYEKYCNLWQAEYITIDLNFLKKEFNIDHYIKKVHFLERTNRASDLNPKSLPKSAKYYQINVVKIAEYLNLLRGSSFSERLPEQSQKSFVERLVFPKGWLILDVCVCVSTYIIVYMLFYFYQEHTENKAIMLSNFKRIPEVQRIRDFNMLTIEGNAAVDSMYTSPIEFLGAVKYVLVFGFLAVNVVGVVVGKDLFNYYNSQRNSILDISNDVVAVIEWLLLYISTSFFLWSIIQYLIATSIYSLIKIYALLPYIFSTICLVFFVWYYINHARKNMILLEAQIRFDLKSVLITRYVERLRHAASYNQEMQKLEHLKEKTSPTGDLGSNEPLSEEDVNFTVSQVMSDLRNVCLLPANWADFIESVLLGERQKMQAALMEIAECPPINLPQGSLDLLSQILTIDENMESPELFISVISSILLKIMMLKEKVFLKDLRLKDLESLKTCSCNENTLLDKQLVCKGCGQTALYEKNYDEIFKLTLEKNTYLLLMIINLMDLIRKKSTGKILEMLTDKIVPEGLADSDKETTCALLKVTYQAFFDIDQGFNRIDWAKSINDLMLCYFSEEQNLLQLLNLLEEGHNDNAFDLNMNYIDSIDTINSVKRSVTEDQSIIMQTNSISHFVSLAAIFIVKEAAIPEKLLSDIAQVVNKNSKVIISTDTLRIIFNHLLFSRETAKSIIYKISLNAQKYFLDPHISDSIKDIKSIASGMSKDIKTKDYQNLENSTVIIQIRKVMNLQPYEMLGFIFLINDRFDDDEVSKFFHHLFMVNNFQKSERTLLDIINLAISKDLFKLVKTFERLKLKYDKIFCYLRGIIPESHILDSRLGNKYLMEIVQELPVDPSQYEDVRKQLERYLSTRNLGPFFQTIIPKGDNTSDSANLDNPKWRNWKMLELVWILNSDEKLTDVLVRFKPLFRELDDPHFFSFAMKIYTVLEYVLKRKRVMMDSTISKGKAVKMLSDLLQTKAENVEKFLELFVSERIDDFIDAFCYFNEDCKAMLVNNERSLKNHIHYIDKSIKFLQAQIEFYSSNPLEPPAAVGLPGNSGSRDSRFKETSDDLGVVIIKKIMMPEIKLKHAQIMLLLNSIITKIFNDEQIASHQVRIMKFFTALFLYVLGEYNNDLGEYFNREHSERFIRTLINCRGSKSRTQRINTFFDDLFTRKELLGTTLFVYLILFLCGTINREEFNLREECEGKISEVLDIQPELFEYLDVYIHKNKLKFKSMLMSVHWKILKQLNPPGSFKKEDVDWDKFYENILSVLADKQPNLTFFSELLKVPLSKLNFVYILNNLRNNSKVDKVLQEANSSSSFKEIVESINIDHTELIQILKICLNRAGFECLDTLVKKMGFSGTDKVDLNMLMCLVTIDAQLMIDPDETRSLVKRMNLYWKLFKKMRVDKDLAWAFIRIIKGDMYTFRKFLSQADTDIPLNHKKFLNIVVALCGCKNSPSNLFNKETGLQMHEAVQKYNDLAIDHRRKKDNSKEAAQVMLWEQLGVHPLWGLVESEVAKKVASNLNINVPIRIFDLRNKNSPLSMFHFLIMNSILTINSDALEIFVNLAFFHNVNTALSAMHIESANPVAQKALAEIQAYYQELFKNVKAKFRDSVLEKKIISLEFSKNLSDYWMFNDMAVSHETEEAAEIFYKTINPLLIENWRQTASRATPERPSLSSEDEQEFLMLQNLFSKSCLYQAFGIGTEKSRQVINDPKKYIEFLDSVVDLILLKMKELNSTLHLQKDTTDTYAGRARYLADMDDSSLIEADRESSENAEETRFEEVGSQFNGFQGEEYEDKEPKSKELNGTDKQSEKPAEEIRLEFKENVKFSPQDKFISDGIIEFCLYHNLSRLKRGSVSTYEEKVKNSDNDFKKIDSLFSIVEKLGVFTKNFAGFTKRKYMVLFSFSQGSILSNQKPLRQKYSLFSPEISLLGNILRDHYYKNVAVDCDLEFGFDEMEFLGRMHAFKRVIDYDIRHLSCYSPFTFYSFDFKELNEMMPKELRQTYRQKLPSPDDFYFAPCLQKDPVVQKSDINKLYESQGMVSLSNMLLRGRGASPSQISYIMLKRGMYRFTEDPLSFDVKMKRFVVNPDPQDLLSQESLNEAIAKLRHVYFSRHSAHSNEEEDLQKTQFEKNLEGVQSYCYFLNDLAHGHYKVLSETRNIFSSQVQYSKYQKIYEAILRLHHLGKHYSDRSLLESLETLAPYLDSDKHKLFVVVEYIVNSKRSNFSNIGKDLDFVNNQIGDLLFLFNANKNTIINWVKSYLKDQGLPMQYQNIIMNLLSLYLRIIADKPMANNSNTDRGDEFQLTANFLMNTGVKGNTAKRRLNLT